ncbi:activating transcription factor 7-interacting protein 2 isoform X1 [Sebastes umbrosus]|uniref:activating transcription factor 7-interacting protein 2 isoform X1 n=2 Tax=Sebastes umbrosus TaxID=72105 RepID=UPI0018A01D9F|nr:activating transcription factor 7-interacting protein 2 isoform X1 [Sebastes umbrosus]
MSDAQDQTHSRKGNKRPARKVNPSTKPKRRRPSSQTLTDRTRVRVDIGNAFKRWRALKAANGLKSDAEVALNLLDAMKRLPSRSASPEDSDKKIKFSQSEVEMLIEQEVHTALKKKESKLQGLIGTIQQLDRAVDYGNSMKKLEARINTVTKRTEEVIAYMTKTQKKSPNSEVENMSQFDQKSMECVDKSGELSKIMETTKKALNEIRADNNALKAAIADLSEELPPPVLTPYGSPDCKELLRFIKKEPQDTEEIQNYVEESKQCEEPGASRVKVECVSPGNINTPKHTDSKQDELLFPPLPFHPFPSTLSMEAASYNIPQRPEVQMALIRNPAGLSVLWDVAEKDPSAPPMDSYGVFMTVEKVKGSNVFPDWTTLGEVKAIPLPMCAMINKYKPGHKVCVAVVGKDTFGRFGPYSKVVTAAIPEKTTQVAT